MGRKKRLGFAQKLNRRRKAAENRRRKAAKLPIWEEDLWWFSHRGTGSVGIMCNLKQKKMTQP